MNILKKIVPSISHVVLLAGLLFALSANVQNNIDNHVATLQLPKGSKKIATTDFEDYAKGNFKRALKPFENGKTFVVDNVLLVSIGELRKSAATKISLEVWKRQLESVYHQSDQSWDLSKIDTIKGNRFYIFE